MTICDTCDQGWHEPKYRPKRQKVLPSFQLKTGSQNLLTINNSKFPDTMTKRVGDVKICKMLIFLYTPLHAMFGRLQINGQYMNKEQAETNFHISIWCP
jgi:hypothetical protein